MTSMAFVRGVRRGLGGLKSFLSRAARAMTDILPASRRATAASESSRARAEALMARLASTSGQRFQGTVLLDGMFDNANYWYRLSLIRSALGLRTAHEIGILGPYNANLAKRTFNRLEIGAVVDFESVVTKQNQSAAKELAYDLVRNTAMPEDVLNWTLPFDVPAAVVYDGILKEQRTPSVDLREPLFLDRTAAALTQILAAGRLLDSHDPALVVLSHGCNVRYAALAHIAAQRGIPVVVAFGNYGVPRFYRVNRTADLLDPIDCPRGVDLDRLPPARAEALAAIGRQYLRKRFSGGTDDIGGQYAFGNVNDRLDRNVICARFGWRHNSRMVAVYAANWFDFPHYMGMSNFRDFADFITTALDVAVGTPEINWLFRRHPVDDFYGGKSLKDVLPSDLPPHVAIAPNDWNGSDLLSCVDAVVTCHGTVGVEAAASGKPVLVAERGWYHDCGFVTVPDDRNDFLSMLRTGWWRDIDMETRRRRSEVFAGWYFAVPSWQTGLICGDDSRQRANYNQLVQMMTHGGMALQQELTEIAEWWSSGARFYHTTKMSRAEHFAVAT